MATETLLRRQAVEQITGLTRSGIYAAIAAGTFPGAVRIGKRAVAWRRTDVQRWISERPSAREVAP